MTANELSDQNCQLSVRGLFGTPLHFNISRTVGKMWRRFKNHLQPDFAGTVFGPHVTTISRSLRMAACVFAAAVAPHTGELFRSTCYIYISVCLCAGMHSDYFA